MKAIREKRICLTFREALHAHSVLVLSVRNQVAGYLQMRRMGRDASNQDQLRFAKQDGQLIRRLRFSIDRILGRPPSSFPRSSKPEGGMR